jgi:glycine/D-amino acid oxidase-like deaminating enzyme
MNPARISYWWDSLPGDLRSPLGESLTSDCSVDVAIVGAGYTGLWTAYHLQKIAPSLRIAMVEAHVAGFGASGRNGGWASALFPVGRDAMARVHGREAALATTQTMVESVTDLGSTAASEGWDIDWAHGGTIVAARTPLQVQRAHEEVNDAAAWGLDAPHFLDAERAGALMRPTDLLGATYTPHCAALHPARLVRLLARTVVARGALLFEGSTVRRIEPGAVRTSDHTIRARYVIRATEGYTARLEALRRTLAPVYSLMLATEPLSAEVWEQIGLDHRATFSDGRHLIIYGQRTADDRIAFGGRGAPYHFGSDIAPANDRDPRIHRALWATLVDIFPVLRGHQVTHTWGGPLGVARDWWPSCGLDRDTGLGWSGGYVGDGVTTSYLGGRTLADLITEVDSPRTHLPWVGHRSPRWEPEPLRWLGVNVGLQVMSRADAVEERRGRTPVTANIVQRLLGG